MPLTRCIVDGKPGWRWGKHGKCYPGKAGKRKALQQARAIFATGWRENARKLNPLRYDPARINFLQKRFTAEWTKRINQLFKEIEEYIVTQDRLGLAFKTHRQPFEFRTDTERLAEFEQWLKNRLTYYFLGKSPQWHNWWQAYVIESYHKGAGRSFEEFRKARGADWVKERLSWYGTGESREDFLRAAFAKPVAVEKVQLLAARTYTDIKNVTDRMQNELARQLADGLAMGQSPREVGQRLKERLTAYKNQGRTVARTETMHAHAEGQLDALEMLGADELGVLVEWSTSGQGVTELGYPSPCPKCESLEGERFTIDKARGMIPLHPNCKCVFIPAGELLNTE